MRNIAKCSMVERYISPTASGDFASRRGPWIRNIKFVPRKTFFKKHNEIFCRKIFSSSRLSRTRSGRWSSSDECHNVSDKDFYFAREASKTPINLPTKLNRNAIISIPLLHRSALIKAFLRRTKRRPVPGTEAIKAHEINPLKRSQCGNSVENRFTSFMKSVL